ncbi:MAG: hypothetical protein K8J08_16740 [Thermoanaerobaculia bacterium]|nr:hypothetical protein [Thermoanaerobaculia bacterium]
MTHTIIPQLVRKDLLIWRKLILIFYGVSLATIALVAVLYGRIPDRALLNIGFTLLITPVGTLGVVLLIQSNVFEKAKSTQPFIMSLPLTVREFTLAKLLFNVPVFGLLWLVTTGSAFGFAFGLPLLPLGAVPLMTMMFLGVFVAYLYILGVSLLSQSLGITILGIMFFELATSAYLWLAAFLEPIASNVWGPVPVWNTTAIGIVTMQVLLAAAALVGILAVQSKKRDFI